MAINEKGEFIRTAPVGARVIKRTAGSLAAARAATRARALRSAPARARSRSSRSAPNHNNISSNDWLIIAKSLAALLLLAGFIYLLLNFQKWVVLGISMWIISSLRQWLQ